MNPPALPAVTTVSPVCSELVLCRRGGILWTTVVVKATFELVRGETARCVAPLPLVQRDEPSSPGGSLARARETAPHVPNAGVVVTGHAHAPDGRAVPSMSVRLGIAREKALLDKTLHVFGPRAAASPAAIVPFQKMPLVYERAAGGARVWENPVGTGGPGSRALPNLVDPRDSRRPAGFGPVSGQWAPRRGFLGGADPGVVEQPVFDAPRGFDWRYFQAAPSDQQLDGIRGDEWILLDGMHAQHPRVQSRLPQARALAVRRLATGPDQPIELRADMLVIDADGLSASIVWRGRFAVESLEALLTMRVLAGLELPGRPVEWPARAGARGAAAPLAGGSASLPTQAIDPAMILAIALPFAGERASVLSPPSQVARAPSSSTGTMVVDLDKVFQRSVPFAETAATITFPPNATLDIQALRGGPALPFSAAEAARAPDAASAAPARPRHASASTGTMDIDLARVLQVVAPFGTLATPAPVAAPPAAVVSPPPVAPPVVALPVVAPPLHVQPPVAAPPLVEPPVAAPPPAIVRPPAMLATAPAPPTAPAPVAVALPLIAPPAALAPVAVALPPIAPPTAPAPVAVAPPPIAPPATLAAVAVAPSAPGANSQDVRGQVIERLREKKSLDDLKLGSADLHELDFRGASLKGLDLHKANLRGAKLADVTLSGARLSGAELTGADLSGADLGQADLSRAVVTKCRFDGAVLIDAKLCDAEGDAPQFKQARMAQADVSGAVLKEASFSDIDAAGSVWDKASLVGAVFLGAKLRGATFQGASLDKASFTQADLTSANLQRATGAGVDLRAARLEAGDIRQAQLPNAVFDDAELRDVSATRADLSGARFFRADLSSANLRAAKLAGADFTQAKTGGADLRDAEITGIQIDPAAARLLKLRLPR